MEIFANRGKVTTSGQIPDASTFSEGHRQRITPRMVVETGLFVSVAAGGGYLAYQHFVHSNESHFAQIQVNQNNNGAPVIPGATPTNTENPAATPEHGLLSIKLTQADTQQISELASGYHTITLSDQHNADGSERQVTVYIFENPEHGPQSVNGESPSIRIAMVLPEFQGVSMHVEGNTFNYYDAQGNLLATFAPSDVEGQQPAYQMTLTPAGENLLGLNLRNYAGHQEFPGTYYSGPSNTPAMEIQTGPFFTTAGE